MGHMQGQSRGADPPVCDHGGEAFPRARSPCEDCLESAAALGGRARRQLSGEERMETAPNVTPTRSSPRKKPSTPPHPAASSPSPAKRHQSSPNNLSIKDSSPSPGKRRKSLRRSVGKKHRRSLPPISHSASELSSAINLEIAESDRLSELLQSCFEFSLRTLENSLSHSDGFSAESFSVGAASMKEKFTRFVERLTHDGTLQRCTEKLNSFMPDEDFEVAQAEIKDHVSKFAAESSRWEELLEDYKEKAVALTRQLEESKANGDPPPSVPDVPTSQDQVLQTKPDYSAMLHQQGAIFDCMEIVLDNLQQSITLLDSVLSDSTSHLQQLSTQLKTQSFKPMEGSPVRTFLKVYKK